jgi:hypothetical protein
MKLKNKIVMKENNFAMKNLKKKLIYIILSLVFLAGLIISPLVFLSFLSNTNIFSGDGILTAYCIITTFAVTYGTFGPVPVEPDPKTRYD